MMRRIHKLTLACLAVLSVSALSAVPAAAKTGYTNLCLTLTTAYCTPGMLPYPNYGVAVDNSSGPSAGDVWAESGYEAGSLRLLKFDASGNLLAEVNSGNIPGSAKPFETKIFGVAVDPADGAIYASDPNSGTVTKFDSSGVFQFQISGAPQGSIEPWGVAVDPSNDDLYVADAAHQAIDKFTSSGAYIEQFSAPVDAYSIDLDATTLAAGPEGDLYVGLLGEVRRYSSTGAPADCPGGGNALPVEGGDGTVAVDPSDGHIFVWEGFVGEYSSFCAGALSATFGVGEFNHGGGGDPHGIGVSGSTHEVYTGNWDTGAGLIFGVVAVPTVTTGALPTHITRSSAVLGGIVNPEETAVTTCEFEYGPTLAYGHTVPCEQPLPLTGSAPVVVSAEIRPEEPPAGLVYYRLKVANGAGDEFGEGETFRLASFPPPVIGGLSASNVTQFTATLNGTLETGEALVNYRFEYGTSTAYGSVEPIPDNYTSITDERISVSQAIEGLQAGTTYHYRLLASSPGATNVAGPDETFTTLPIPAPTVATGAAEGIGVGAATLTGTIDPHGWNTEYLFEYGPSTAYGSSWPTVQVDMGALEGPQPALVNVPNLLPSTTYHYRLVATNGGGTSYGPDMTFTTGEYPAQVIQEPVALRTLLVPTGEIAKLTSSMKGKQGKKGKKVEKGKARHRSKHPKPRRKAEKK
jgi:NHL repeat